MISVIQSCKAVVNEAKIKIDLAGCRSVAEKIYEVLISNKISSTYSSFSLHPTEKSDRTINWIFTVDCLNYCFWLPNGKQYTVTWEDNVYSGYYALCAAINRACKEGIDMTDAKIYSKLSLQDVKHILRGDDGVELQLLEERHLCLQEAGEVLLDKFQGSFANCVRKCSKSALKLLDIIVSNFSYFRDESTYKNKKVSLYKRAQIVIGDLWSSFQGQGLGEFTDINSITMFADYRVPQVLCYFGVLKYPEELWMKLSQGVLLNNGDEDEVEIRACSVVAVNMINDLIHQLATEGGHTFLECNNISIDMYLWTYRRNNESQLQSIPFHKTITIYY